MKLTALALITLLASPAAFAQEKKQLPVTAQADHADATAKPATPADPTANFEWAKFLAAHSPTMWSLALEFHASGHPAHTATDLDHDLAAESSFAERPSLLPYKSLLVGMMPPHDSLYFFYTQGSALPFMAFPHKGVKLFVAFVASEDILNRLRLSTPEQRASRIVGQIAIPCLRAIASKLADTDFGSFCVFVTYGTKDPSAAYASVEAEVIGVMATKADLKALADAEMTKSEFLQKSMILVAEHGTYDFLRIDLRPTD
jgi:hypothetical protein